MTAKRVVIAADHLGLPLKDAVKAHLEEQGVEVVDMGVAFGPACRRSSAPELPILPSGRRFCGGKGGVGSGQFLRVGQA